MSFHLPSLFFMVLLPDVLNVHNLYVFAHHLLTQPLVLGNDSQGAFRVDPIYSKGVNVGGKRRVDENAPHWQGELRVFNNDIGNPETPVLVVGLVNQGQKDRKGLRNARMIVKGQNAVFHGVWSPLVWRFPKSTHSLKKLSLTHTFF